MEKIRCLIVDDEKLAQEVLAHHISKFDILKPEGICNNVFELIAFLNRNRNIDLIFLDIKMPEISGTDFVDMFNSPPAIIYTTAYDQYAAEAFGQNAIDYLLKPISLDRFSRSIQKAVRIVRPEQKLTSVNEENNDCFYVRSDKRLVKIDPRELIYIEGMGNYLCFHTEAGKVTVHATLSAVEESLKHLDYICRVHKSYFVNLQKISYLEQHVISLINKKNVPVGLSYRDQVYEKLKII